MNTYMPLPVTFIKGEGCWLYDENNNKYLDAVAGIAVCSLGHCHPSITQAVTEQVSSLVHTSNLYGIQHQTELAEKLTHISGMDSVFFGNSGAEANEAAIKLARLYGNNKGVKNPSIIVMENSFHGRTLATLTATGNRKVQAGFEPLVPGFTRVPYNDIEAIETVLSNQSNIVAILVEPIQGESGVNIPADDYLNEIRDICDEHELLMMLDEIQTGICRTGEFFAFQHNNIVPDVMTLAKALGNGLPIGACLAKGAAADVFQPGNHGSTYGGNPLVCKAAIVVIETMQDLNLAKQAEKIGADLITSFTASLEGVNGIKEIRGKGLMFAIELEQDCPQLVKLALEDNLLINVAANNTIRLLPPLTINEEEIKILVDKLSTLIKNFLS